MNDINKLMHDLEKDILSHNNQVSKAADPLLQSVMQSASLRRDLATEFINLVVDESVLLRELVRVHRTDAPSGDIAKLNVNTQVTEVATENTDSGNTRRPVDSVLTFNTVKMRSALDVTGEWQEDNIEGAGGRNTVLDAFFRAIANDVEQLAIEGDSSEAGSTDEARLIKANDGYNVLTTAALGARIVDAGDARASYKLLAKMLTDLPTKYKRDLSQLRWIMSWGSAQSLVDEYADRVTDFGDQMRSTGTLPPFLGIPVVIVPKIPEDLTLSGTAGTTGTFIWLTQPRNFTYIVQRDFRAEWERVPRSDRDELTIHMRNDFLVENTDAVVKATNVSTYNQHSFYS
jgi:hypothetical protein